MTQRKDDGEDMEGAVGTLAPVAPSPAGVDESGALRVSETSDVAPLEYDAADADRREGIQAIQEARDLIGVTAQIDPLKALLAAPVGPPVGTWLCQRLDTTFQIRAVTNEEYNKVQDQATRFTRNRRTGRMDKDLDAGLMSMLTCVFGTTSPDFRSMELRQKYQAPTHQDVVARALLPGEVDALATEILKLSGFDQDLEEAGKGSSDTTERQPS